MPPERKPGEQPPQLTPELRRAAGATLVIFRFYERLQSPGGINEVLGSTSVADKSAEAHAAAISLLQGIYDVQKRRRNLFGRPTSEPIGGNNSVDTALILTFAAATLEEAKIPQEERESRYNTMVTQVLTAWRQRRDALQASKPDRRRWKRSFDGLHSSPEAMKESEVRILTTGEQVLHGFLVSDERSPDWAVEQANLVIASLPSTTPNV